MTADEYGRLCAQLALEATQFAAQMVESDAQAIAALAVRREHWIDVFLDERLPDIHPEVLLSLTAHADAFDCAAGHAAPSRDLAACHAFQVDVWDAINQLEEA